MTDKRKQLLSNVPGIRWSNLKEFFGIRNSNFYFEYGYAHWYPLLHSGYGQKETPWKIVNQQFVFHSRQCSSTPFGSGQEFLSKEQCDNTSILLTRLHFPSTEICDDGTTLLWCYWHNLKCDWRAEEVSTKWLPGMLQTLLQYLAEEYSCTRGLFWKKCSLIVVQFCISKK
jgi:hypothetical protein